MRGPFERRSAESCLSQLQLDRLLADEQTGLEKARDHLKRCERCAALLEELRGQQKESLKGLHQRVTQAIDAASAPDEKPFWQRLLRPTFLAPALVAAAASLLVVVLVVPGSPPTESRDVLRLKGGHRFNVLLVTGGEARRLTQKDRLEAGDLLAFQVGSRTRGVVSIVSLDRSGEPSFLSHDENRHFVIEPGPLSQLPLSAQLDDAAGSERVFAIFCKERPGEAEVLSALDRAYPRDTHGQRMLERRPPRTAAGCAVASVLVRRRAARGSDGP